jgi:hypothetical protein
MHGNLVSSKVLDRDGHGQHREAQQGEAPKLFILFFKTY